ncbi:jasmonate-induced protein homolog [Chenopodium quinoa]|uniref:jasmonate-induced protein homolog n=1 Tax=Chenopodium quinoa TaxID=63459 RepID=UPI000B777B2A|nr:jasmonate-induced protein homolog [Chenopodium quinoa]
MQRFRWRDYNGIRPTSPRCNSSIRGEGRESNNRRASKERSTNNVSKQQGESEVSQDELVLVTGVIKNLQPCGIMLNKSHDWKGQFIAKPHDKTIGEHASGGFVHQGVPWQGTLPVVVGSKGSMIYGHIDNHAPPKLGWLLAWDKPDNPNELKRVYVEAGHLGRLMKMEWNEIEQKLDASRSTSHSWDSETGAVAAADIKDYGEKLTLLRASFDHSPTIK